MKSEGKWAAPFCSSSPPGFIHSFIPVRLNYVCQFLFTLLSYPYCAKVLALAVCLFPLAQSSLFEDDALLVALSDSRSGVLSMKPEIIVRIVCREELQSRCMSLEQTWVCSS